MAHNIGIMSQCLHCGDKVPDADKRRRKFCSTRCRRRANSQRLGIERTGLPTGTTGTISELRVCVDLLARGYEVFRAVSANCSCDLAVLKDGALLRIEVRTAYENKATGSVMHNRPKVFRADVYAGVLRDRILYDPSLE